MDTNSEDRITMWEDLNFTPRDILTVLFKHKIIVLLVFLMVLIPWTFQVILSVPMYEAYSSILLKIGREHLYRPEVGSNSPTMYIEREASLQSEIKILKSEDLAKQVVKSLGVQNIYPKLLEKFPEGKDPLPEAAGKFLGKLNAEDAKGSDVIEITFVHPDPKIAAKAVNQLVETLKEKHLEVFSDPHASFLETQLASYGEQLTNFESELQDFKKQNRITSPIEQQRLLLVQRGDLYSSLNSIQNEMQGMRSKVSSLNRQMKSVPEQIPLSTVTVKEGLMDSGKSQLLELQRQEQELLARYTEASRPVKNVRRQIELVEKFINQEQNQTDSNRVTTGKNPIYQKLELEKLSAESDLKSAQARINVITNQIEALDRKLRRLDDLNDALLAKQHDIDTTRQHYNLYLTKVEEAHVSEEMDRLKISNISVIQPAIAPRKPIGHPKNLKILLGAVFGLMAGVGLAFAWEFVRGGYTRADQAARDLELPVLASVSYKG